MKTNFLIKLFYILFLLSGIQLAYASSTLKKLSFVFNYGQGIDSVYFDQTNMESKHTYPSATFKVTDASNSYSYTLTVQSEIGSSGDTTIANDFNKKSPRMEVGGSATSASSLDFMFDGVLKINRRPIGLDHSFVIGHENYKSSNADWWIANTSSNSSLYGSGTSTSITVQDDIGNYYCLNKSSNNYTIIVNINACDGGTSYPSNWSHAKGMEFEFIYGTESIESIVFVYNYNNDDIHNNENYLESVEGVKDLNSYKVTVTSKIAGSTEIATSFINKVGLNPAAPQNNMLRVNSSNLLTPDQLNFWIEGSLYINGELVASDFTLAQEKVSGGNKWWIGSTKGSSYKDPSDLLLKMQLGVYCFIGDYDSSSVAVYVGECQNIHNYSPRQT